MSRLPYAATTLIRNVLTNHPDDDNDVVITHIGEPDGLGVIRTIRFDPATSTWLEPLLFEIADPRIVALDRETDGLYVRFSHRPMADSRAPFPLADAALVVGVEESTVPVTPPVADLDSPLTPDETP